MSRRRTTLTLAVVTALALPGPGRAQSGGDGFLFRQPRGTATVFGGWAIASAHSDLYSFTTDLLTLDRGDFSSLMGGIDLGWRVLPRTSVVFSFSRAATRHRSEFRDFVDNDELPIEQTTSYSRIPLMLGVKQYLTPTGRQVGRFAWIPARVTPFVGAGAGAMYYRFSQYGDFIDFETMEVFARQFTSSGWAPAAHALAGLDFSLNGRLALTAETRYVWSSAELSRDFSGFQRLDLAGLATTAGLTIRY